MKLQLRNIPALVLGLFISIFVFSCSSDEEKSNDGTVNTNLTIYRNPLGAGADALQAHYKSPDDTFSVNFYGLFDAEGNPTEITTVSYQKTNNDTIVNLVINPGTHRLASTYNTVNGVKSPIVHRYDYNDADNTTTVSVHDYNWIDNTTQMLFSFNVEGVDNSNGRQHMGLQGNGTGWNIAALGAGIAVAEAVAAYYGGFSGLGALAGVAAPIIAAAAASSIVQLAAIGVVIYAITTILNSAHASELDPVDYPPGTPVNNPTAVDEDPSLHINASPCTATRIKFRASMDSEGRIMITEVQGGQGPYMYLVDGTIQSSQVFTDEYQDGPHVIAVQDSNGCITGKLVTLTRNLVTKKWYSGTYTLTDTDEMNPGPFDGQSGEIYLVEYKRSSDAGEQFSDRVSVAYIKSIVPDIPNLYIKGTHQYISNHIQLYWGQDGVENPLHLNIYVEVDEGVSLTTQDTKEYPLVHSRIKEDFGGEDQLWYYIDLQAYFTLAYPPAGLTPANLEVINGLLESEEGFVTIEE